MGQRQIWLEAARQATETGTVDLMCPEQGDGPLQIEWIGGEPEGEYRIWCAACGAQNYVLVRDRRSP